MLVQIENDNSSPVGSFTNVERSGSSSRPRVCHKGVQNDHQPFIVVSEPNGTDKLFHFNALQWLQSGLVPRCRGHLPQTHQYTVATHPEFAIRRKRMVPSAFRVAGFPKNPCLAALSIV